MRALVVLTAAVLLGCGGPQGSPDGGGGPRLATIPRVVDFGVDGGTAVTVGLVGTASLKLYNSGGGTLVMSSITLSGDPEFTANRPASMSLDAGQETELTVSFSPTDARTYTGQVVIRSNATNAPNAGIPVQGVGVPP